MKGLKGKVALVTGGGSGIGKAICLRLAESGVKIGVLDIDENAARNTAEAIGYFNEQSAFSSSDISDYQGTIRAVESLEKEIGQADILVNCAGWDKVTAFKDTEESYRDKVIDINLKGHINITHIVVKGMVERGAGRVITISSDGGRIGSSGQAVYSACKAGLFAFSKTLAREYARNGVTFNVVCPGPTKSRMMDEALSGDDNGSAVRILKKIIKSVPLGRIGEPEDVAGMVAFFASDEASFITGQVISVSGGLTMVG